MADAEFHIPVPHPLSHIILGPPRYSDGPFVMAILNDARVYMKLYGPPYPYTEKDWDDWYQIISSATSRNVEEPTAVKESHQGSGGADPTHENLNIPCTSKNTMWTFSIRQIVQSDSGGKEEFIGAIGVSKDSFLFILDEEERRKRVEENNSLEPGDPRIHWEIGCKFDPCFCASGSCSASAFRCLEAITGSNIHSLPHPRLSWPRYHVCGASYTDQRDPHSIYGRPHLDGDVFCAQLGKQSSFREMWLSSPGGCSRCFYSA